MISSNFSVKTESRNISDIKAKQKRKALIWTLAFSWEITIIYDVFAYKKKYIDICVLKCGRKKRKAETTATATNNSNNKNHHVYCSHTSNIHSGKYFELNSFLPWYSSLDLIITIIVSNLCAIFKWMVVSLSPKIVPFCLYPTWFQYKNMV